MHNENNKAGQIIELVLDVFAQSNLNLDPSPTSLLVNYYLIWHCYQYF